FLQFALFGGGRKGRGRHIGSGRFRLRLGRRRGCTGFFRGRRRPPHIGLLRGRGLGGRGRPPHIPHIGEVGGGPGFIADDAFGDAEQIYSDILVIWLEASAAQVGGGDLQAVEQR